MKHVFLSGIPNTKSTKRFSLTGNIISCKVGFMDQEPVFILAQNYNTMATLKQWLTTPAVFFTLFIWVMATIVSVKILDTKPFKWVIILTILLLVFKILPMTNHPEPMTQEQITQLNTQMANAARANSSSSPTPVAKAIPVGTPSAQLINN